MAGLEDGDLPTSVSPPSDLSAGLVIAGFEPGGVEGTVVVHVDNASSFDQTVETNQMWTVRFLETTLE